MIGRRETVRMRRTAEQRLPPRFDIGDFRGPVLGDGAVPLGVLKQNVLRWVDTASV